MDGAAPTNHEPDGARNPPDQPRRASGSEISPASSTNVGGRSQMRGSDVQHLHNTGNVPNGIPPTYSWSTSLEKQIGHESSSLQDRVFPIRSVVSVDPTQTPFVAPGYAFGDNEGFPGLTIPGSSPTDITTSPPSRQATMTPLATEPIQPVSMSRPPLSSVDSSQTIRGILSPSHDRQNPADARRYRINSRSDSTAAQALYGAGGRLFSDASSEKPGESINFRDANSSVGGSSTQGKNSSTMSVRAETWNGHTPTGVEEDMGGHVTARFKHVVTSEGHAVITGRDGETLQRCEDEPIHIPGAVQGFGLLIAIREDAGGQLVVRIVSENSQQLIGYTPAELFKLKSFTEILPEEQIDNLLDHIDFIRDEDTDPSINGPEVFITSVLDKNHKNINLWCAMHIHPAHPDTIICEFELDDDQLYPLIPPDESLESPEDTLHIQPTEEEFTTSTRNRSKPLRVLRSARKRKGEAAAMEVFNIMSQVQEQLASAPNLESFLNTLVGVVKELTGFHRVMVYQFDSSFNGRVVTELVDPRATKDLYHGLNFPASDIPKQARELYKINKVRLLYDRDLESARLVCRTLEDLEIPLDLTYSYLRAMSPIHIKYLANMAVRSSMSISINAFNDLWGLISCHGYGSKGTRVSFPIRKMCRLVGDTASRNIERLSYASRLQARKLINTVPTEKNPSGYIIASSDDLLKLFDADFGLISIQGETKILGKMNDTQEALAMLEYLRLRNITSVVTSQDIKEDFPDLRYPPGFKVIAGLLLVPLSVGGQDFIAFFRQGQTKEVKWAGNPYEKFIKEGTEGYLEPRKSFGVWRETVIGKCREWTEEEVETASVLCLVYGKFIEVWRQKEAALQSSQLTRLLLANSAHEVRTPLNAIINYLEIALEGVLDQETREYLIKSHSASKSLIYVINDLLDLTKAEEGQELIKDEVFDLPATIREATDIFSGDAKRKGIEYVVTMHPGIPRFVHGDQRCVRQAVTNVTANAMQNTSSGSVTVDLRRSHQDGRNIAIDIVVEDTGAGMSNQKLDSLFRELEQVSTADGNGPLNAREGGENQLTDGKDSQVLGLGLAIVARIVRNMNGQLRLKSEEGKGSRFAIQLPFEVTVDSSQDLIEDSTAIINRSPSQHVQSQQALSGSEVMLVDKSSSTKVQAISRQQGHEDSLSLQSFWSGSSRESANSRKSEVDRLIDAISEPLSIGRSEPDETSIQRTINSGSANSKTIVGNVVQGSVRSRSDHGKERPNTPTRSKSSGSVGILEPMHSLAEGPPGYEYIRDNKTLLKAVRVPDDFMENSGEEIHRHTASRVLFDLPNKSNEPGRPKPKTADHLQVLVAEDDPVNSKIIKKRLEKAGHEVYHTVNGEECATVYKEKPAFFDVILMDMQMPIVDGLLSTKMIRSYEKTHLGNVLSPRANANGRVPILAVSASLIERERKTYIDAGFDGWILKPIDFNRVNLLLNGIVDEETRESCLYQSGQWENGGFFERRQLHTFKSDTTPSINTSLIRPPFAGVGPPQSDENSLTSESSGSTANPGVTTPIN